MPDSTNEDAAPPATTPRRNPKPEIDEIGGRKLKPSTLMMGHGFEPALSEGSLKPPIFATSTFVFPSAAAGKRHFEGITGKRSEEHTSELQSLMRISYAVFCLKTTTVTPYKHTTTSQTITQNTPITQP